MFSFLRLIVCAAGCAAVAAAQYSISAPEKVKAGGSFEVTVDGELKSTIIIAIVKKDHAPGRGPLYAYFHRPPTASLRAPDEPGDDYELRLLENHRTLLATRPIVVEGVTATLDAPANVDAGAPFEVAWSGPNSSNDTITMAKTGAPPKQTATYAYLIANPVKMTAPDEAGEYELRYVTGQSSIVLATRKIVVGGSSATIEAPSEIEAGRELKVSWTGPGNSSDTIAAVNKSDGKRRVWTYPALGDPAVMTAPLEPGDYELRYVTGQSRTILARAPLLVRPASTEPGKLVVETGSAGLEGAAVEIIFDASGSMLQRMGAERRIDVAKRTLTELASKTIPAGTPFALRVFGKEVGSCRTDLDVAKAPLDPAAVSAKIAAIEARNNAKTPIGASLRQVRNDLSGASRAVVVLITDGEETCDGDPAAEVAALNKAGIEVRVNIVGFAIADQGLRDAFEEWARLGGGSYFSADDATGLQAALSGAVQPVFEVTDSSGRAVATGTAGGEPITLVPGSYSVKIANKSLPVRIESGKTTTAAVQ